jgi:hypothetical protein
MTAVLTIKAAATLVMTVAAAAVYWRGCWFISNISDVRIMWNITMQSAATRATFIQFQDTLAGDLNRLMEFLVMEQAEAQENCHVALGLLQ